MFGSKFINPRASAEGRSVVRGKYDNFSVGICTHGEHDIMHTARSPCNHKVGTRHCGSRIYIDHKEKVLRGVARTMYKAL